MFASYFHKGVYMVEKDLDKDLLLPTTIRCKSCGWEVHWLLVKCNLCGYSLIRQKLHVIAELKARARGKAAVPLGQYPP